jgi:hypothetical protein
MFLFGLALNPDWPWTEKIGDRAGATRPSHKNVISTADMSHHFVKPGLRYIEERHK